MKNTRHELFLFSFYDVTGMARHLEKWPPRAGCFRPSPLLACAIAA